MTLIVASGIANAGFRAVGSFNKLFDTYGNVLFAKIGIVAVMLPWLFSTKLQILAGARIGRKKESRCWLGHIHVPVDKNDLSISCNAPISLISGVRLPSKIREVAGRHCHIRQE